MSYAISYAMNYVMDYAMNYAMDYARYDATIHRVKRKALVVILGLLLAACSGPAVQPLMPTPVVFSELGFSPMDHIPEDQRWTPRRARERMIFKDLITAI